MWVRILPLRNRIIAFYAALRPLPAVYGRLGYPPLDSSPIGLYEGFFGAQPRLCRTFVLERFRDDLTVVGVFGPVGIPVGPVGD